MDPFIGQIIMFGGNFAPRGWALCDGQLLPISSNTSLFSILGTIYGGDGRTTFKLPDLRGRSPIHEGQGPGLSNFPLGSFGGTQSTTLVQNNLPPHSHTAVVSNNLRIACSSEEDDAQDDPSGHFLGPIDGAYRAEPDDEMNAGAIAGTLTVQNLNTGNGTSFTNYQPYQAVNYIIALVGTFPSRS